MLSHTPDRNIIVTEYKHTLHIIYTQFDIIYIPVGTLELRYKKPEKDPENVPYIKCIYIHLYMYLYTYILKHITSCVYKKLYLITKLHVLGLREC